MPALFSNEEYADMVFVSGFCDGNAATAVAKYQRRCPNRRIPDRRTIQNTYQSFDKQVHYLGQRMSDSDFNCEHKVKF
jgi:hypothetical protein